MGGKCPDTSQHREETLPHLLSPSQRLWCCHIGKEPTSASGSACMDSWRLDEDWERAGHCYILTLLTCTFWSSCCSQHYGAGAGRAAGTSPSCSSCHTSSAIAEGASPKEGCRWKGHRKRPAQFVTTLLPAPECFLEGAKANFVQSP